MLTVMVLIWGINFSIVKISLVEFNPIVFTTLRFIVGSLALLLALKLIEKDTSVQKCNVKDYLKLGVIGTSPSFAVKCANVPESSI